MSYNVYKISRTAWQGNQPGRIKLFILMTTVGQS